VTIGNSQVLFARDETIFMEISQKYSLKEVDKLAGASGFAPVSSCSDTKGWFTNAFWKVV
jgi:L-histidine N-alpha-methyltransferase